MISFDEAGRLVRSIAQPLATESVPLDQAHGRVLAEDVVARVSSPFADVSAMDGYALRSADLEPLPVRLTVIGEAAAGRGFAGSVEPGTAVRIFTGAPVPAGADRVIIQEHVRREEGFALIERAETSLNIRAAGSDFQRGETLIEAGTLLGPRALVAAAAADRGHMQVWRRPRLRVVATGDELAEPGAASTRAEAIPESISFGVAALARHWGGEPLGRLRLRDDLAATRGAVAGALDGVDLLIVTGGASVGERDFARAMFGPALELIFSKVAIKPGKPVWLGRVGATLVLGLPGNPTSALVTARLFLAPLLAGLTGRRPEDALGWRQAPLSGDLAPPGDRETFSRAGWQNGRVSLLQNQESGAQKQLLAAELLVRRRVGHALAAGEPVDVLDF